MKKVFVFLLVLMLLCPTALADVQSQVNAPAHITDTFQSNTGKIVIRIDAEVTVPNADSVPIYGAEPRYYTQAEMDVLCNACFGDIAYSGDREIQMDEGHRGYDAWYAYHELSRRGENAYFDMVEMERDGKLSYAEASFYLSNGGNFDPQVTSTIFKSEGLPRGCSLTAGEAAARADALVQQFAPDFILAAQAKIRGDESTAKENGKSAKAEAWVLFYTRGLSLPVTCDLTPITGDTYGLVPENERITVVVSDMGIEKTIFSQPHQITGILQADCALLSFDQMMQAAAAVMPLKYAWLERGYADVRFSVTDIRLGYMRVMRQDAPGQFMYAPVWDFFGTAELRQKKGGKVTATWEEPFNSLLTVNAIDGTVIDRNYGY